MHGIHMADLLGKKARGEALTREEIQYFVSQVASHQIDQVQLGAMLMAIFVRGMTPPEVTQLTDAMAHSGRVLRWPAAWLVVDKHSTGGVGDKVSLVLAPALAACGFRVPMVSGRGLGHTGGTLDKLEAIPGFNVSLSAERMLTCLERVGCCIVGQTADLVPADRVMYASRDVTNTVASTPLITSSIISKKAAEGLQALVLDVKYGSGAFMKDVVEARDLAQTLVDTSDGVGIRTAALLTNMDSPIGQAVGNALEVAESILMMQGNGPADLVELVTALGGRLVALAGRGSDEEGRARIHASLHDGTALSRFEQMLVEQGVSEMTAKRLCHEDPWSVLTPAEKVDDVVTHHDGYVAGVDAMLVAQVCGALGAGRRKVADNIDHRVGVTFPVRLGDRVQAGDVWAKIHHCGTLTDAGRHQLQQALTISPEPVSTTQRVAELVTASRPF